MQWARSIRRWRGAARLRATLLWCGMILLAGEVAAASADELRPGIIGGDDRTLLTKRGPPWDAVGQVNIGGFRTAGQCTGTLVAPRIVITAAHCLTSAATGRLFPPGDIHFLAAVRGSDHMGHSIARCLRLLDGHAGSGAGNPADPRLSRLAADAAVIVLDGNIGVEPAPLAEQTAAVSGLNLIHVAYPGDRRFVPVVHDGCRLLGVEPAGRLWFNDCDTHPGSSGGPVFVLEDGAYKVAAIQVAAGASGANVALPSALWAGLAGGASCP